MKDLKTISEGVQNWNKIAGSLHEANKIMQAPVEFLLSEELPLDDSQSCVNVYFGYQDNTMFAVLIQASKDLPERYKKDIDGVLKDMVIVNGTRRLLTTTTEEVNSNATDSSTQIEIGRALKRIARWEDEKLRMKAMKSVNTAPLIFEVPKVNFEVQGQKKLLFGLKTTKKCCFFKRLEYDLLLKAETNSDLGSIKGFYDYTQAIPPRTVNFSKGLYEYLGLPF